MTHIKINDVSPRIRYRADGTQTAFTFPFAIFKQSDMEVYLDDVLQNSGYSISGVAETNGGSVIFTQAPANNTVITLYRNLPIDRQSDFQDGGAFRAQVINDELDYQVALVQQMNEKFDRCLSVGITDDNDIEGLIPRIFAAENVCSMVGDKAEEMIAIGEQTAAQLAILSGQIESIDDRFTAVNTGLADKLNQDFSNFAYVPPAMPQISEVGGVGYVMGINATVGINYFTVPAGGSWFVFFWANSGSQILAAAPNAYVVAGGTTIGPAGTYLYGFAWRIA